MLHSTRFEQPVHGADLGNKVSLLRVCIKSNLGHVNEYKFGPHGIQSWLGLIRVLRSFFYNDLSNILAKLGCMDNNYLVIYVRKFPNVKMRNEEMERADLKKKYCFFMLGKDFIPSTERESRQYIGIISHHIFVL